MNGYSILVVEDNPTTARTLRLFLEAEGYGVDWASAGREGLRRMAKSRFDLVLLDLMLPDLDGLDVCREIRSRSNVPIVMLTARTTEGEIVAGLDTGADDYIGKPFGAHELLARIRRCLRESRDGDALARRMATGDIVLDKERREVIHRGEPVKLTRSEFDILELMMRNPGRVYTRGQIIEYALGPDFCGYDRTVDTHIWSLRRKLLEPQGNPRYIHSELGIGYRFKDRHAV